MTQSEKKAVFGVGVIAALLTAMFFVAGRGQAPPTETIEAPAPTPTPTRVSIEEVHAALDEREERVCEACARWGLGQAPRPTPCQPSAAEPPAEVCVSSGARTLCVPYDTNWDDHDRHCVAKFWAEWTRASATDVLYTRYEGDRFEAAWRACPTGWRR